MGYRYIGAKTRIVGEILPRIQKIVGDDGHIADLMCGTGAVSAILRQHGYRVTANDLMTFCYHHARVALLFQSPPTFFQAQDFVKEFSSLSEKSLFPLPNYEAMLASLNAVPPDKGYFWREYSPKGHPTAPVKPRNYFSAENAAKIDGVRGWIRKLRREGRITDLEHSLLLHDLIMAVNDVANIAGTYGHYLSTSKERSTDTFKLKPTQLLLMNDNGKHAALKGYAEAIAQSIHCDLCYIDPPYMKRQYAANYHILETLAREDEPDAVGVSGLRPWRDQYSNFCTKTRIRDSFRKIFSEMDCTNFLVSYSEDGLLALPDLKKLTGEFGEVDVVKFAHRRFRSNNSPLNSHLTEYLIHLKMR